MSQQRLPAIDALLQDLRHAVRSLHRDSRFSILAIVTLTLGIGATTTIFSLVRGVLLDPLPYPQPEQLVRVYESNPQFPIFPVGPYGLLAYRHENRTLSGFAGYTREDLQLAADSRPERLRGLQVSSNYFQVLGVLPARGRGFTWAEERKDANVAILSDAVWRSRFHGDPAVVGRAVRLSGRLFTIVGIMPAGFEHVGGAYRSPAQGETVDVWWPLPLENASKRKGWHYINAVARLKPGVTAAQAQADLGCRVGPHPMTRRTPGMFESCRCWPMSWADPSDAIRLLTIAVGLLMLIACANVSSLLLARATARQRERAVRFALGASRWRLLRQSLVESIVLALPGAAGGALVAFAGVGLLLAVLPQDFPRLHNVRIDWAVLAFAIVLSGLSVLVFGLLPAWQQASDDVHPMLHDTNARTSASGRTVRLRNVLVVCEIALASALLIGAGLLVAQLRRARARAGGFDARPASDALLALPDPENAPPETSALVLPTARHQRAGGGGRDRLPAPAVIALDRLRREHRFRDRRQAATRCAERQVPRRDARVLRDARHPARGRAAPGGARHGRRPARSGHQSDAGTQVLPRREPSRTRARPLG